MSSAPPCSSPPMISAWLSGWDGEPWCSGTAAWSTTAAAERPRDQDVRTRWRRPAFLGAAARLQLSFFGGYAGAKSAYQRLDHHCAGHCADAASGAEYGAGEPASRA